MTGGALHVIGIDGTGDQALATPEAQNVTYGLAEFVAAEEMYRTRGFWWSPDGQRLLVARVDTTPVMRWHISDPANPERPPTVRRLPAGGHRQRHRQRRAGRPGRRAHPRRLGRGRLALPDLRPLVGRRARAAPGVQPRPADHASAGRGRRRQRQRGGAGHRPRLGRRGARHPGLDQLRRTGPGGGPRRRLSPADRGHARDRPRAERAPGARRRRRRAGQRPRGRPGPAPRLRRQPGRGDPGQPPSPASTRRRGAAT